MSPWFVCALEQEILSVIEADVLVSTRYLCALLFPTMGWVEAQGLVAEAVRAHCQLLVKAQLLAQTGEDGNEAG